MSVQEAKHGRLLVLALITLLVVAAAVTVFLALKGERWEYGFAVVIVIAFLAVSIAGKAMQWPHHGRWIYGVTVAGSIATFLVWRRHEFTSVPSLGFVVLIFSLSFAFGLIVIGSPKSDKLSNQIGLAIVTGLVLASSAFVVNLVLEDAFETRDRARREAETKLAINRRVQWVFRSEDLHGFNFSGMSMTRPLDAAPFDFSFADMSSINLQNADLRAAVLGRAHLEGGDLSGANLAGANLAEAKLQNATLNNAILSDANLSMAQLTDTSLESAVLTGAQLVGAYLTNATLTGADLTGADLTGADLTGADLTDAIVTADQLDDIDQFDKTTICPSGEAAMEGSGACAGEVITPAASDEQIVAHFQVDSASPLGHLVGRTTKAAGFGELVGFELTSVCSKEAEDDDEDEAEDWQMLMREDWPLAVGAIDGLIQVAGPLKPGTKYLMSVRLVPPNAEDASAISDPGVCNTQLDSSGQPGERKFVVEIEKEQDHPEPDVEFLVPADAAINTVVALVPGDDLQVATGGDPFRWENDTLVVSGILEANTRYEVDVQAIGSDEESQPVRVIISVVPPNEPPQIAAPPQPSTMSATAEPGHTVVTLSAMDPDPDDSLSFRILSVERSHGTCVRATSFFPVALADHSFFIDIVSGTVTLERPLVSTSGCHRLLIEVRDDAVISLPIRTQLEIAVRGKRPPGFEWPPNAER